ncbi:DUF6988 family protein [Neptuniibacter sp. PT8_73]|uniref:DUF6988 family protein n=1 Tax=Neptuniibacter sp. PT8_73 TaxID=3398206 RepID=UPI0039F59B16
MNISENIGKAKEIGLWVHSKTSDITVPSDDRTRVGVALLQHALDIADSILLQFENNLPGPAFTLFRSLHEAYVRGVWLLEHASEDGVVKFIEGKPPGFKNMLNDIGSEPETGGQFIAGMSELNKDDFHGLTHGGMEHVIRRVTASAIEPNYPEEEILQLIKARNQYYMLCACFLLQIIDDEKGMSELLEKQKEWSSAL